MRLILINLFLLFTYNAFAGELFIYPNKGQPQEQQGKDRYECHVWAVKQTGFDPSSYYPSTPAHTIVTHTYPRPYHGHGGLDPITGAASGAAMGAVGGAIAGDAGAGAAIGAGVGAVAGLLHHANYGMKKRERYQRQREEQVALQAQQEAEFAQLRNNYNRAISACLEARDYTVR